MAWRSMKQELVPWRLPDPQALCSTAGGRERRGDFQIVLCNFFSQNYSISGNDLAFVRPVRNPTLSTLFKKCEVVWEKVKEEKEDATFVFFSKVNFLWNLSKVATVFLLLGGIQLVSTLEEDKAMKDEFIFFTISPCIYK